MLLKRGDVGYSKIFTGAERVWDEIKNYALVLPAAPLAVSAIIMTANQGMEVVNNVTKK